MECYVVGQADLISSFLSWWNILIIAAFFFFLLHRSDTLPAYRMLVEYSADSMASFYLAADCLQ